MQICRVFSTFQIDFWYSEHYLAKELFLQGHHTTFLSSGNYLKKWEPFLKSKDGIGNYEYPYFKVERIKSIFPLEKTIWTNWLLLNKRLFNNNFDVIHSYGIGTFSTAIILLLSTFSGSRSPRLIVSDHSDKRTHSREGIFADMYYLFFRILFKIFGRKVGRIITPLPEMVELLSNRFKIDKSRFDCIPVGYDSNIYFHKKQLKNNDEKMIIGFAGKLSPGKKLDVLLKAISQSKINKKVKVIIVGVTSAQTDYINNLVEYASDHEIKLELKPFMSKEKLADFYNYIDLAVYPGGISITTIEASGCGVPVVIYKSLENLESRVQGGRGILFDTIAELGSALKYYLSEYEYGGINNQYIASKTHDLASWANLSNNYHKIYANEK